MFLDVYWVKAIKQSNIFTLADAVALNPKNEH
jgi:hypothetical protein